MELLAEPSARAQAFLELARLYEGPLAAPAQAEAAARQALAQDASLDDARALLFRVLEREGRVQELAALHEELAARAEDPDEKVRLFVRAAELYRDPAGLPNEAAAAMLAARSVRPDDGDLTARCADLLHDAGRPDDAAEFDAVLLESEPLRADIFERHAKHLDETGAFADLAALLLRRAERLSDGAAAAAYLEAAAIFRRAGAKEQAQLCEERAFDADPSDLRAFEAVRAQGGDVRREAELLARRAAAVPEERVALLRERAQRLLDAGEQLFAAEAFDQLLAVASPDQDALQARAELAFESGGPEAAQPFDRRLLQTFGEALPVPVRVRAQLRLGHAALGKGALVDAADAFEVVVALDAEGEGGAEALSLLSEVHARTGNAKGLYRTSLRLAERAEAKGASDEAEALLRRAADLFDAPADAVDALSPLAKLRPSDPRVVERAAAGLRALGRVDEVVEIYERGAQALGGGQAAGWLLQAADLLEEVSGDEARAFELRARAGEADPNNAAALRALAEGHRRRGETSALREALEKLAGALDDADERALVLLEAAALAKDAGEAGRARAHLEAVSARGPSGAGYVQALEALLPLYEEAGDAGALGEALLLRAELESGVGRASLEMQAARALERAGDLRRALVAAKSAVAASPDVDGQVLVASLCEALGDHALAARAWQEAQAPLKALEAFERAGQLDDARALLDALASASPVALSAQELSQRYERLGDALGALTWGFPEALGAGRADEALRLADWAGDEDRILEALWRLCEATQPAPMAHAARLEALLVEREDEAGRLRLLGLRGEGLGQMLGARSEEIARAAGEAVLAEEGLDALLTQLPASPHPALVELAVLAARAVAEDEGDLSALTRCADLFAARRRPLLRELFELHRARGRPAEAAAALEALLTLEEDLPARGVLYVELGEVYLRALERRDDARASFELALTCDLSQVAAVQNLLELVCADAEPEHFVAMVERLGRLLGPAALGPWVERLAFAYERLGRIADAFAALGGLPETPERLHKRAQWAQTLGLTGEALQLQERITEDAASLVEVALGYARAALVPFAVRLGERLLAQDALSTSARRELAERLSSTVDGAAFAVALWPALLREAPSDVDGWTLFAEALHQCGRHDAAVMVDGFGAALCGTQAPSPPAPMSALPWPEELTPAATPVGLVEITADSMPRLHAALSGALTGLGAPRLRVYLHAGGGVEAWLRSSDELVLGAGALGAFGPVELGFLCALALALGPHSRALAEPGEGPDLTAAAVRAFEAHPASLAAGRVLAQLDARVRGSDPQAVDVAKVLADNDAFLAVARRAVDLV